MISTNDLCFEYSKNSQLFKFPSLFCGNGEELLIIGNSGKGKTTLLSLLGGLLKPKSGDILINNTNVTNLNSKKTDEFRRLNTGIIFQKSYLIHSLNVLENLELASWIFCKNKQTDICKSYLIKLGLRDKMKSRIYELSIGQQQRVSIACALLKKPSIILADEPTSSLDDMNCEIVLNLLIENSKELNSSLIIVSHDTRIKDLITNKIELI
jgi:ABC-type lipoprotein export system ATPase subunit